MNPSISTICAARTAAVTAWKDLRRDDDEDPALTDLVARATTLLEMAEARALRGPLVGVAVVPPPDDQSAAAAVA